MLTLEDLSAPAPEVCRTILRAQLEELLKQGEALRRQPEADETLHDTRVAARRFRVWQRLATPLVDIPRKSRRAIRRFTRASSPVRDLEVQLSWLAGVGVTVSAEQRPGWAALQARLSEIHDTLRVDLLKTLRDALKGAHHALERLDIRRATMDEPFGSWMSEQWLEIGESYLADLHRLPEGLHPLRLTGKQLRYILEPMVDALDAGETLRLLRKGQDAMGRMNDAQVFAQALPAHAAALLGAQVEEGFRLALEMRVAPRWSTPSTWSGLRALSQALIDEEAKALAEVHGWRLTAADRLAEGLPRIGVQLARSAAFDGFGHPK